MVKMAGGKDDRSFKRSVNSFKGVGGGPRTSAAPQMIQTED